MDAAPHLQAGARLGSPASPLDLRPAAPTPTPALPPGFYIRNCHRMRYKVGGAGGGRRGPKWGHALCQFGTDQGVPGGAPQRSDLAATAAAARPPPILSISIAIHSLSMVNHGSVTHPQYTAGRLCPKRAAVPRGQVLGAAGALRRGAGAGARRPCAGAACREARNRARARWRPCQPAGPAPARRLRPSSPASCTARHPLRPPLPLPPPLLNPARPGGHLPAARGAGGAGPRAAGGPSHPPPRRPAPPGEPRAAACTCRSCAVRWDGSAVGVWCAEGRRSD